MEISNFDSLARPDLVEGLFGDDIGGPLRDQTPDYIEQPPKGRRIIINDHAKKNRQAEKLRRQAEKLRRNEPVCLDYLIAIPAFCCQALTGRLK